MKKIFYYLLIVISVGIIVAQNSYSLEDLNSTSTSFGNSIGPSYYTDQVTLHYFGHYNWGTCTARFGQLNDLYQNTFSGGDAEVKLFGVGKDSHMSSLGNWINGNDCIVSADSSPFNVWDEWEASQRDLYIIDHEGNISFYENITGGFDESEIISLVNELVDAIDISVPGDINGDGEVNVLDVVSLVNGILSLFMLNSYIFEFLLSCLNFS